MCDGRLLLVVCSRWAVKEATFKAFQRYRVLFPEIRLVKQGESSNHTASAFAPPPLQVQTTLPFAKSSLALRLEFSGETQALARQLGLVVRRRCLLVALIACLCLACIDLSTYTRLTDSLDSLDGRMHLRWTMDDGHRSRTCRSRTTKTTPLRTSCCSSRCYHHRHQQNKPQRQRRHKRHDNCNTSPSDRVTD